MRKFPPAAVAALIVSFLMTAAPGLAQEATLSSQVQKITLDNGLNIYVLPRDFSPTFTALYGFDVGAALEPKGRSGIAHLLEHMMFKGSQDVGTLDYKAERKIMDRTAALHDRLRLELDKEHDPFQEMDQDLVGRLKTEIQDLADQHKQLIIKNELDELFTRAGGVGKNAGTGSDGTTYFVRMPANQLETWFRLESERILHPVFREFYSERDVVASERRENKENTADGRAYEALSALMYKAHPYGAPIIGWMDDIQHYSRRDAESYFRTFYSPNNCTMVLVGDVDLDEVERLARKYLGSWERQKLPPKRVTLEPEQEGQRRAVVEFDAEPSLSMGWVTVPTGHADAYSLEVLGSILGGIRSARLDRSLVYEQGLAAGTYAYSHDQQFGGAFVVGASPRPEHSLTELEEAILTEIERIQEEGVTPEELERAKVSVEVRRVRRLQSNMYLAFTLNFAAQSAGRIEYLEEAEKRIESVTAEEVQKVARRYLTRSRRNVVEVQRPAETAQKSAPKRPADFHHSREGTPGDRGARHSKGYRQILKMIDRAPPVAITVPEVGRDIRRVELPSGITLYLKEDHSAPAISMRLTWLGGSNSLPVEELPVLELAADLLMEGGTESLSPAQLEERIDELGMSFRLSLGATQSSARLWSLARNFDESLELAVELLTRPRLDPDRLEVLKAQFVRQMKRRRESPDWASWLLTSHVLYQGHPRLDRVTTKAEAEGVTPERVQAVLESSLGAPNLFVTVVGDFESAAMEQALQEKLGDWNPELALERDWLEREPAVRPGAFQVEREIPQPAVVVVQEMKLDRTAPPAEHAALEILNDILGGSGFRSRLMERMRSDEGLTYGVYSWLEHEERPGVPGQLWIGFQTGSDSVARSVEIVTEEIRKIRDRGVSDQEVAEQIQSWRNRFIFKFEDRFYSVARLMAHELDERPYDRDRRVLEEVQRVTPEDVLAAARKYLDPEKLTVTVYGSVTPEDEGLLQERFGLTKLPSEEVFRGGY